MTFGEVVSSYNMFGNSAAKRHNHMMFHQETHMPDNVCTIHDKVAILREKDPLKSASSSTCRGLVTPRWTARSRTPSPLSIGTRRHRSLPSTPRASTPTNGARFLKDHAEYGDYLGEVGGAVAQPDGGKYDNLWQRGSRYAAGAGVESFAVDNLAGETFTAGSRNFSTPARGAVGVAAAPPSEAAASLPGVPASTPVRPQAVRSSYPYSAGTAVPFLGQASYAGYGTGTDSAAGKVASAPSDPRAASFVRLNNFLLRTHITSLVSALAEDGWLEPWEKERLCSQAREDSQAWTQGFFRIYMRFLETEDVNVFVASLRAQIV